jgi:cAMP phosphodiesterase
MRLRVLGCSGSIGGQHNRTTSFLVDHDILVDAGTGVGDLSLAELTPIDHIFITHSHLDHVDSIAFFLDSVGALRPGPVTVYATGPTIEILKKNLFNWDIWPDFTAIPTPEEPWLRYREVSVGEVITLGTRRITVLPAIHTVPAVGYLKFLIIETAFSDRDRRLAELALHLCPAMLGEELAKLEREAEVYITHLKPSEIELTMQEIDELSSRLQPRLLQNNHVFEF